MVDLYITNNPTTIKAKVDTGSSTNLINLKYEHLLTNEKFTDTTAKQGDNASIKT
jgi:hypothetical protein